MYGVPVVPLRRFSDVTVINIVVGIRHELFVEEGREAQHVPLAVYGRDSVVVNESRDSTWFLVEKAVLGTYSYVHDSLET